MTNLIKHASGVTITNADKGEFEAVFATFDVTDKDGDIMKRESITEGAEVVISAYGHMSHAGALPVGKGVLRTTETEAIVDGHFFLKTTHGRETFETVKELDALQEWSFNLRNIKRSEENQAAIVGVDIKEVSPVLEGAGIATRTLSMKDATKFSEHVEVVMTALKALTDRAVEVETLRSAEGKSSATVADLADQLKAASDDLATKVAAIAEPEEETPEIESGLDPNVQAELLQIAAMAEGIQL